MKRNLVPLETHLCAKKTWRLRSNYLIWSRQSCPASGKLRIVASGEDPLITFQRWTHQYQSHRLERRCLF
jgi:hypothetical protein